MKTRVITALLLIVILFPIIAFGGIPFRLLEVFVVVVGGLEFMNLSSRSRKWPAVIRPAAILFVLAIYLLSVFQQRYLFPMMSAAVLFFLSIPVFTEHFTSNDAFLCISYVMLFFFTLHALEQVQTHPAYIWLIIIATYGCDTGAYFGGRFLGRHKMNERVSPKKTWEARYADGSADSCCPCSSACCSTRSCLAWTCGSSGSPACFCLCAASMAIWRSAR